MFENLSDKLQSTLQKLKGKGKLSEKDIDLAMKEVKMSLLEADVNYKVVKTFVNNVKERALGSEVMESLTPGQQVVKIVHDELVKTMGQQGESKLKFNPNDITYFMMCGLQGAGKTTATGKLARKLKKDGKKPLLVACDIYRPAAIKQLEVVGESVGVPVFQMGDKTSPVTIAKEATKYAMKHGIDVVIIDTAGRLHIDESLMDELVQIKQTVKPEEILLLLDAMTGQDAVKVAETFNQYLDITGVILTKVDGDARGGAALSIRNVVEKPIKFLSVGEKMDQLEIFYPDRMASRILGMGDVLSIIEKAQDAFDEKQAIEMQKKLKKQDFNLDDFLQQLQQMKNMGPLEDLLGMIPGIGQNKKLKDLKINEKELVFTEAIIQSMTKKERANPNIINGSRRKRIAAGSGTSVQRVNQLLKQYDDMKKMMKKFSAMEKTMGKKKGLGGMGRFKMPF
ncbi:signal recognition particle protein [Sedimentibacter saalensis]|jgi:signal recognition particle subunit SRP54|uniref:Signal recognition particle protein n=2 Tax=root TaxID=1 RepID=A0A562JGY5_9FIRM|nr:signal recognition particle protein [Sedimentibacter saalensis]MEA5094433.1 signal recognition particle protein [Sedimentibacter saalensis]TWH82492.1 signal recognition particle subunit FFH/SRP54 (srp54) [Sedimentibacter saalensis]